MQAPEFWNGHVKQLAHYIDMSEIAEGKRRTYAEALDATEREQLQAYRFYLSVRLSIPPSIYLAVHRRAWIALWILVAAIVITLWVCVLCIALRRCALFRTKPYDNIVVTKTQGGTLVQISFFNIMQKNIYSNLVYNISGDNTVGGKPISTTARLTHWWN